MHSENPGPLSFFLSLLLFTVLAGCPNTDAPDDDDDDGAANPYVVADLLIEVTESRSPGDDEGLAGAGAGLPYGVDSWWVAAETVGDCTLFAAIPPEPCDPPCDYPATCNEDDECEYPPDAPYAGTITVDGLAVGLTLVAEAPYYYYLATFEPDPVGGQIFDEGDPIVAQATGGDVPGFTVEASGVADLDTDLACPPDIEQGQPLTVRWTPGTRGDPVRFSMRSGNHGTQFSTLVCEPADTGELTVDASLLDAYLATFHPVYLWVLQRSSTGTASAGDSAIALDVSTRTSCMY